MQLYVFIYIVGILSLLLLLLLLLLLFFIIKFVLQFFFRWSIKFPLQNINQSETEIRGRKLSVEMYVSVLFKLKHSLRLLRRFNFIRYKKQHVRLLLLRFFCILLLNWDIRLPSLCGFHISHRKIWSERSDYAHYAVLLYYCQNEISDYCFTSLLLKWNIWLR